MFSPALLGNSPFRCSASATASVKKPARCMEVPVTPEQGLQRARLLTAHGSTQGCSCLFQECHCPGLVLCLHLTALQAGRSGAEGGCARVPIVTALCPLSPFTSPSHRKIVMGPSQVGQPASVTDPLPKLCTSFPKVSAHFDAADNLANTKATSNPASSFKKGAITVLGAQQALSFACTYVRAEGALLLLIVQSIKKANSSNSVWANSNEEARATLSRPSCDN